MNRVTDKHHFGMGRIWLWACVTSFALLLAACSSDGASEERARTAFEGGEAGSELPPTHPPIAEGAGAAAVAGITWSVPTAWTAQGERPMRAATYTVPAASADNDPGECAVYYFGADQGGSVDANVERWVGQFDQPDGGSSADVAQTRTSEVDGMNVTWVDVAGIYTASMGPGAPSQTRNEDYRMLAAIIEGPQGAVFFKFTGPASVVEAASGDFTALVESVRRAS